MATTTFLVVSDLHLGGPEGFRMCTAAGADRLAAFLDWARDPGGDGEVELVLAGDLVDFLAEPDDRSRPQADWTWSAFTAHQGRALAKLELILGDTAPVWDALARYVTSGHALTLMLGNHDLELSLPRVRRRLVERIAPRGGRVELLFDGEALRRGQLLVEHGNYEGWNAVSHEQLRRVRAELSRGRLGDGFEAQPGSELVARVMNPIKRKYAFVDLLKPEMAGVLPILAVLDPRVWGGAGPAIVAAARAAWRQARVDSGTFEGAGIEAPRFEGAPDQPDPSEPPWPDEDAAALAQKLAAGEGREGWVENLQVDLLLRAFRKRREKDEATFDVGLEARHYREPAERLASSGHRVVVFGHSHHAKRLTLPGGATYLNTGTWADLMRLPESIYQGSEAQGEAALRTFLDAVRANDLAAYRRQVPTYARVELDTLGQVTSANVHFFEKSGAATPISTAGILQRLGV